MENFVEPNIEYQQLADEIDEMALVDQKMRQSSETWDASVDEVNTSRLKEIVSEIGWPTVPKVGTKSSNNAWLLVQHADHDVDFQEYCLELMQAESEDEVSKSNAAYLVDRVRVNRGLPQVYGTQFSGNDQGDFGPREIENFENIDKRREDMGMESFEEYEKTMRKLYDNKKRAG